MWWVVLHFMEIFALFLVGSFSIFVKSVTMSSVCSRVCDATHKYTSLHCWYIYIYDIHTQLWRVVYSPTLCLKILAFAAFVSTFRLHLSIPALTFSSVWFYLANASLYMLEIFGAWSRKYTHIHTRKEWHTCIGMKRI